MFKFEFEMLDMTRIVFLLILISFSSWKASAQTAESNLQLEIDDAVALMNQQSYKEASKKFQVVIEQLKPLPSRIAFYFGKNSYFTGEYKQSINWLSKYIQLKGTNAPYYDEAKKFLELSEKGYLDANKTKLTGIQEDLSNDFECSSQDKMVCPACKGTGVLITKKLLQNHYETCPFSGGDGYLTCSEYNLFLKGKLKPSPKAK